MKRIFLSGIVAFIMLVWLVSACIKAPEFPVEPTIAFDKIEFKRGATEFDDDTLALTIKFQDGDGDLGLSNEGNDVYPPYNDLWYFIKEDGSWLTYSDRFTPPYDTLPPYEFPYFCINYFIDGADTFYVQPNEYHYNIHIKYFVRKNGEYQEFDWLTAFDPVCGQTFNGRFPLLNTGGKERPLEGKLTYKMKSAGFELLFRQDTLRLEVYIYDRALNKSNVINTPDFVLKDISTGG